VPKAAQVADVLRILSGPPKVPSAIRIPPLAAEGAAGWACPSEEDLRSRVLMLGPGCLLNSARDQKCRSTFGLKRNSTPQTLFTMPLEVAWPDVLLSA